MSLILGVVTLFTLAILFIAIRQRRKFLVFGSSIMLIFEAALLCFLFVMFSAPI